MPVAAMGITFQTEPLDEPTGADVRLALALIRTRADRDNLTVISHFATRNP